MEQDKHTQELVITADKTLADITKNPFHEAVRFTKEDKDTSWNTVFLDDETPVSFSKSTDTNRGEISNFGFQNEQVLKDFFAGRSILLSSKTSGYYNEHMFKGELGMARRKLLYLAEGEGAINYFNQLPIPQELKNKLIKDKDKNLIENLLLLDDDELFSFIKWNFDYLTDESKIYEEKVTNSISEFISVFNRFKNRYNLPIDMESVTKRIDSINYTFIDPIISHTQNIDGYCNPKNNHISIKLFENSDEVKKIVFHELLHSISGGVEILFETDNDFINNIPCRWINEGFTEQLALILLNFDDVDLDKDSISSIFGDCEDGVYNEYRKLLKSFFTGDLKEVRFLSIVNAYFEKFYIDLPEGKKSFYAKRLYNEIMRSYSKSKLDFIKALLYDEYADKNPTRAKNSIDWIKK